MIKYDITVQQTGVLYFYIAGMDGQEKNLGIYINGTQLGSYGNASNRGIVALGSYQKGDRLRIALSCDDLGFPEHSRSIFMTENMESLNAIYQKLAPGFVSAESINEKSSSDLTIKLPGGYNNMICSLLYNPNWRIHGGKTLQNCRVKMIAGAFTAVVGEKEKDNETMLIDMNYIPAGWKPGIMISLGDIVLLSLYCYIYKNKYVN